MPAPAHVFVTPAAEDRATALSCKENSDRLLNDSLPALYEFAASRYFRPSALRWSDTHTPYFRLTARQRTRAIEAGAIPVDSEDAAALDAYWQAKTDAALARLRSPPPYPIPRKRSSVSLRAALPT